MFKTELEMSKMFEKFLKVNFGNSYIKEYQGLFGIPDFVFYSKTDNKVSIVSFELKLKNWKRAVTQAFRYKCFSNISYVVLPTRTAHSALRNIQLFERYKIGLAKFDGVCEFEILYKPKSSVPFSDHLNQKVLTRIKTSRKKSKNVEVFV